MKKLTKKQRGEWARKIAQLIEEEAESSQHLYDFLIKRGDLEKARHHESPTKKQREQWAQLFERYAASGDSEQAMVIDIAAYLSRKLSNKHRAGINLINQAASTHSKGEAQKQKKTEDSSKGGQHSIFTKVHDLAETAYYEEPEHSKADAAREAIKAAEADPKKYGLARGKRVPFDTIYRELLKRTKSR